jgi:hypothetical protein
MKKVLALVLVLLFAVTVNAADLKKIGVTADGAITSTGGYLTGILVHTDGANSVTVSLYDNATEASGSKVFSDWVVTSGASDRTSSMDFKPGECPYFNGLYLDITTGGSATVDFFFSAN